MFRVVVVDKSAESRSRILQAIEQILRQGAEEFHFVPRVSLKPLAIEEIKFHGAPDVCVVGEEIAEHDLVELHRIRKLYPAATLLVKVPTGGASLAAIEQLARCGADDVIAEDLASRSFLQKLILLSQKASKPHQGRLILVVGGKGGCGVTSIAAALAERAIDAGKRVVLVDCDFETQDLSRFLRARPYSNENLQLLLDESSVITEESVRAALVQVWADEPNLVLMPPPPETRALYDQNGAFVRILLGVFEQLDALCDCIIVDAGCASGAFLEMLYRLADHVLYVVPNDPAALFASVDRVKKFKSLLGETARLTLLSNEIHRGGLSSRVLTQEFARAAEVEMSAWAPEQIPFSREARRWPGSGSSMATLGNTGMRRSLSTLLEYLEIVPG